MEDNHIFMLCKQINSQAFSGLDSKYTIRKLNRDELDIWKTIHFDNESDKKAYKSFMDEYYQKHYADREKEFFKRCFVLCENDTIIGTCFTWKNKAGGWTLQWFKVKHEHAFNGLGRQLLSYVLQEFDIDPPPILLHTHPVSYAALKLYSDFGFAFVTDSKVGNRENQLEESKGIIRRGLGKRVYNSISTTCLPKDMKTKLRIYQSEDF